MIKTPNELLLAAMRLSVICKRTWNQEISRSTSKNSMNLRKRSSMKTALERAIPTQYSSSSTASRATNMPKFRLCNPIHSSSLSCSLLKESSGSFELSLLETADCQILWLLSQWTSRVFHLECEAGKASLEEFVEMRLIQLLEQEVQLFSYNYILKSTSVQY